MQDENVKHSALGRPVTLTLPPPSLEHDLCFLIRLPFFKLSSVRQASGLTFPHVAIVGKGGVEEPRFISSGEFAVTEILHWDGADC